MDGAYFNVSPLKELFLGGVALLKGNNSSKKNHNIFPLFKTKKEAEEYIYLNNDGLKLVLYSESLKGIYEKMPIYFNGMKIGKVYRVDFNQKKDKYDINCDNSRIYWISFRI